ncbi:hypothetical protein Thiosp_02636 [Thiorhodovibrio litoralis]|nr:hypothetical protein Thiosp_02636 [Thiorhodovibrio litoralis]
MEVLQELIDMAKEVRAAQARGEAEGLSQEKLAFYDALAENESAVEVMGSDELKVIAHELLVKLQGNITVDWAHRENAGQDPGTGEARLAQVRVTAGLAGNGRANGVSAGGGLVGGVGEVT